MGKTCQSCGAVVSDAFYRVFYPDGAEIESCIFCDENRRHGFEPPVKKTIQEQ